MKSDEQYRQVIELKQSGMKIFEIVKITGLTRGCVNNWIRRGSPLHEGKLKKFQELDSETTPLEYLKTLNESLTESERNSAYSFILGMYLGDGCIYKYLRTKQLTIALDKKYQKLNDYVINSMKTLFNKEPNIYDRSIDNGQKFKANCINVRYYSKHLGLIFPHEGAGAKHLREIKLTDWQTSIISPVDIVKGLIMSDGSYYFCNTFKKFKYTFSNCSLDICNILMTYLGELGIVYNFHKKKTLAPKGTTYKYHVDVAKQSEVTKLHNLIGDKNNIVL